MKKSFITAVILIILFAISIISIRSGEGFSLPPKLIVLFMLLFIAAVAFKLKFFWLRYPILITSIAFLGFYEGSCLCPNGALQNIFLYISTSKFGKIGIYLFEITFIFALIYFLGNLYCGWVCQKGGVQEFLFRKKLAIKVPEKVDRVLRFLPYVMLVFILSYPLVMHHKIFGKIDPFKALFNLDGTVLMVVLLGIVLFSSVFIYRPYCRYFCPFGVVVGAVNAVGLFNLSINGKCINCNICEESCSLNAIQVNRKHELQINKKICIACMECVESCPKNALEKSVVQKYGHTTVTS